MTNNETTINVAFDPASPTSGIQEAIDVLGKKGGCVRVPAGEWPLRASVVLSSRVQLIGDGSARVGNTSHAGAYIGRSAPFSAWMKLHSCPRSHTPRVGRAACRLRRV